MMKKIYLSVIAFAMSFMCISIVSASQLSEEQLDGRLYIIGKHVFTEDAPRLDTPTIMLASKTIEGDSLEDMIIYFKPAGSDTWVDIAHENKTVSEPAGLDEEDYFEAIDLKPQVAPQDVRDVMDTQANSFKEKYYNKYSAKTIGATDTEFDESIYYIDLGEYVGSKNPTSLKIENNTYDTNASSISIGNYSYIEAPVWKISEAGHLLVALPWLAIDSLPYGYTTVIVGGVEYQVQTYADISENALTISEVKGVFNQGYTNEATLEGTNINYVTAHSGQGLGIKLAVDNEVINDLNQIIFRRKTDGTMGFTFPEKNGYTYAVYIFPYYLEKDANGKDIAAPFKEVMSANQKFKLAIPGYGVIELNINATTEIGTTTVTDEDELIAALAKTDIKTINVGSDLNLTKSMIVNGEVTINLNGKTLTSSASNAITNNGKLTITGDGKMIATAGNVILNNKEAQLTIENGKFDAQAHQKATIYNEGGMVIINDGTFTRSKENGQNKDDAGGNSYYTILNHGNMTINDGTFENAGKFSSMFENGYYDSSLYSLGLENPTLTINNGTFTGGLNTIKNDDNAILHINDGEFTGYYQSALMNYHEADINGGTFDGIATESLIYNTHLDDTHDKGILSINGGTFKVPSNGYVVKAIGSDIGTVNIPENKAVFMNSDGVTGTLNRSLSSVITLDVTE